MKYNPRTKGLTLSVADVDAAANLLLAAIHYTRESAGLPLAGYKDALSSKAQTAEYCILNVAERLGIDLEAHRPGQLDVRENT